MKVYCTSKNTGPSWNSDPIHLLYLGTSVKKAEEAVGNFTKYAKMERDFPARKEFFTILPKEIEYEMIQYFMADGWWYSIVMFELEEE